MTIIRGFFERERSVLLLMLLTSLVAHAGAFWLVAIPDKVDVRGWAVPSRVHVMQPALERGTGRPMLYYIADRMDPALIALPSLHGFSGKVWSKTIPLSLQAQQWSVDPAYLEAQAPPVLPVLLAQPPVTATLQAAVGMVAAPASEPAEPVAPAAVLNRSVFQLRAGLENRTVIKSPALPAVAHLGGLRPTMVRVGVGVDGLVKYATLERSSGSDWADARAMEAVRQLQFEPVTRDGEQIQWGMMRFHWATTVPETNAGSP
jgi:TonB family protein